MLATVVTDLCAAQVVFLGEERSHGGGRSIQVKTDIVRALIQSCGFTHIAFEAQIYDFIGLEERYAAGIATREALYDAIGAVWSRAAETNPLVDFLHESSLSNRLTISGFDGQIGGAMGHYTITQLPQRLSQSLPRGRRESCFVAIDRLAGWKFDRTHPKNQEFDESVLGCAREIEAAALEQADPDPTQHRLARSFRAFLEYSATNAFEDRDRLMAENLDWAIARLPSSTKTIVWTATIHGLKRPLNGREGMASHYARGAAARRIRSVAVIAAAGQYAAPGTGATEIAKADADSLEGIFSPKDGAELAYIDRNALRRLGSTKSRVISYDRYDERDWSQWLDGVVVFASEALPTYVRPARPTQGALK